ncbi:hypothetical protein CONLIGDRAFT_636692 [Coniochaeta ligniaria NRRL 30616]|uniref:Uncharacterized protein n=1 Tax=Coniochaeta ligniaria NRRL 30616 TaxID=1408157 RepID=A0A1J7ITT0_9PEZI|nr:hypothetical protein CONLIGDRAFT_636692 [Coniochaeta ligniaria NRRL 30616]
MTSPIPETGVGIEWGLLPVARAQAGATAIRSDDGEHEAFGVHAAASVGGYTGLDATATAYKYETEGAKLKLGLGVDTGAGVRDGTAQISVLGTGLSFGRETGFKFLGSEFKLKLW